MRENQPNRRRMNRKIAIYPGSFDPITFGHLDLIERASGIFEQLVVGVGNSDSKKYLLPLNDRLALVQHCIEGFPNVSVQKIEGLTVDSAASAGASIIVRGVRDSADYAYESRIARSNLALAPDIETILMIPSDAVAHISSTIVREIYKSGGSIASFVPAQVVDHLR